jgi:signal peptidase I
VSSYPVTKKKRVNGVVIFAIGAFFLALGMLFYNANYAQFYIPSESMMTTLRVNDRVIIEKTDEKTPDIERGDIIVFEDPGGWLSGDLAYQGESHLIKRVIAVGGDTISCCDVEGNNIVNGEPLNEPYVLGRNLVLFSTTVPEGYVWVEGDNRENSSDSRYNANSLGGEFVPLDKISGKALAIVWPFSRAKTL